MAKLQMGAPCNSSKASWDIEFTIPGEPFWRAINSTGTLPTKKGRAPLEALRFQLSKCFSNLLLNYEALPFVVPLNPAVSSKYTSVDEVCEQDDCNCRSYHRAPSFQLSSYIDSHVTAQVLIFVITLEVSGTGINMSIVIVVKVVLSFILGHDITSLVVVVVICFLLSLECTAQWQMCNVSRLIVGWEVKTTISFLLFGASRWGQPHLNLHPPNWELRSIHKC